MSIVPQVKKKLTRAKKKKKKKKNASHCPINKDTVIQI